MPNVSTLRLLNGLNVSTPSTNCKGNGKTLGFSNGTTNYGAVPHPTGAGDTVVEPWTGAYGQNVGVNKYGSGSRMSGNLTFGITTDASKSGIITNAMTSTISNYQNSRGIIKY